MANQGRRTVAKGFRTFKTYNGSKIDGSVGAAFVVYNNDNEMSFAKFCLPDHSSIYQAEQMKILKTLEEIANLKKLKFI